MKKKTKKPLRRKITAPKKCFFCEEGRDPWFLETESLSKFVSDRGKIVSRVRTGLCAKHQRQLTLSVKHARHLALMPFVTRII